MKIPVYPCRTVSEYNFKDRHVCPERLNFLSSRNMRMVTEYQNPFITCDVDFKEGDDWERCECILVDDEGEDLTIGSWI